MKTLQGSMGNLRSRELSITSAPDHSCSDLKHRTHSREKRTSNKISEFALWASGLRPCMHLITVYFMMLFPDPLSVQSDFRSEGIYIYIYIQPSIAATSLFNFPCFAQEPAMVSHIS